LPPGAMLSLPGYNLRGGLNRYHSNGVWANRWFSTAFKDQPEAHWGGDKFHQREPVGVNWTQHKPIPQGEGGTMHLWASSLPRLHAKHRLYRCTERVRWPQKPVHEIERMYSWAEKGDAEYHSFGTPETWTYADVPGSWWAAYASLICDHLHLDAEPWQNAEADRIIAQYGREYFKGLSV